MADDTDDRIDGLYALPLGEFVAARNALAKELEQPEVRKLKKPTGTAWVLNQLARRHPEEVAAFLDAGRRVAETQAGAVRGRGSAPFREAVHAEREALNPLLARTRKLVKGESQVMKVADALRAAAADAGVGEAVRTGRLSQEPESSGFGGLTASDELGPGRPEDRAAEREAEDRARVERERKEAQQVRDRAEQDAARLTASADEAEQRAARLRAEGDEARRRAEEAAQRLESLE